MTEFTYGYCAKGQFDYFFDKANLKQIYDILKKRPQTKYQWTDYELILQYIEYYEGQIVFFEYKGLKCVFMHGIGRIVLKHKAVSFEGTFNMNHAIGFGILHHNYKPIDPDAYDQLLVSNIVQMGYFDGFEIS